MVIDFFGLVCNPFQITRRSPYRVLKKIVHSCDGRKWLIRPNYMVFVVRVSVLISMSVVLKRTVVGDWRFRRGYAFRFGKPHRFENALKSGVYQSKRYGYEFHKRPGNRVILNWKRLPARQKSGESWRKESPDLLIKMADVHRSAVFASAVSHHFILRSSFSTSARFLRC